MRNKRRFIFFIVMLSFLLYACGNKEDQDKGKDNQNGAAGDQQKTQEDNSDKKQTTTNDAADTSEAAISEQVLYDEGGLKITATALDMEAFLGPELKVLVENNTDKDLTIQTRDASINNLMVEPSFSCDVAAGKKANDAITFFSEDLEKSSIDQIAQIELRLKIFTSADFDTIAETDPIIIPTSAKDTYVQNYDDSGDVLYDKNGIKIVNKGLAEDEFFGPELRVYLENNTTQPITVQVRNVSVNGFMTDPVFSSDITPGKKAYDGISFFDMEENDIEKIEEVELSFHIFEMDSMDDIDDSEPIKLTFK